MEYGAKDNLEIMKFARNYNAFLVNLILKYIKKSSFRKILDFGCSDGYFIEILKKNIKSEIVGIDCDKSQINICKSKNIVAYTNLDEIKEKFDFIYSLNTLEHILDDDEILKQINLHLYNNGKLFLYLPAFNWLFSSMDEKTGHYRRYNKHDIKKKLENSGFFIEKIKYCDFLGVFITLIYILKDKIKNNKGNINKLQIKIYDKIFLLSRFLDVFFSDFLGKNLIVVAYKK